MQPLESLIARLERAATMDRRLDAEIMAAVLGPVGCVIDPIQTPDGWDIQEAPDVAGEAAYWMIAEDIPLLTISFDAAISVVQAARPAMALTILNRALQRLNGLEQCSTVADAAARAARLVMVELLRAVGNEQTGCSDEVQAAA